MLSNKLKPCPLCGGKAQALNVDFGHAMFNATISCQTCGLTLRWNTEFMVCNHMGMDMEGGVAVKHGLDPIEAWNRRTANE